MQQIWCTWGCNALCFDGTSWCIGCLMQGLSNNSSAVPDDIKYPFHRIVPTNMISIWWPDKHTTAFTKNSKEI
jgi:hypothetical protein